MSLRHTPRLTSASISARRANALKSTGPRAERGKARAALNALKHGGRCRHLPESLLRAGCPSEAAHWHAIRARLAKAFEPAFRAVPNQSSITQPQPATTQSQPVTLESGRPATSLAGGAAGSLAGSLTEYRHRHERWLDQMANLVCCAQRGWQQHDRTKLECPSTSVTKTAKHLHPSVNCSLIEIRHPWARLGLVFYAQRRRGWIRKRMAAVLMEAFDGIRGPKAGPELESGLRSRAYRLGRPRFWERIRFCLDRDGCYHSEWRAKYRRWREELRAAGMAEWLEPHPMTAWLADQG